MARALGDLVLLDRRSLARVCIEQRRALPVIEVVRGVVHGASIELEGLAMSRQSGSVPGSHGGCLVRLAAEAGTLVVERGMDLRRAFEPGAELGGPSVEPPSLRGRDRPVERVAQQLVPEVVQVSGPGRIEDEVVHELLERRVERLGRHVHDPGEDLGDEAATDDGPRAGGGLSAGREVRDPRDDGILDRLGDGGLPDGRLGHRRLDAQRSQELLDVERDPVRPLEHRGRDLPWCREPRAEDQGGDQAVSARVSGASRTSSAMRCVMSRVRQSRRLVPARTSSVR